MDPSLRRTEEVRRQSLSLFTCLPYSLEQGWYGGSKHLHQAKYVGMGSPVSKLQCITWCMSRKKTLKGSYKNES